MVTVWWSAANLIHYSFLNLAKTVSSKKYAQQIDEMQWKLQSLKPALVNRVGPILLHDNARSHIAQLTLQKLNEWGYKILPHPPYSPDLLLSSYYFFKHLDTFLKGKHFHNQQGAENAFQVFAKSWITNFYSMRISKLNFSAKMFDYIFWLIKIHLSLVKMISISWSKTNCACTNIINIEDRTFGYLYCCCCLVTKLCLTLCDAMICSTLGLPVPHYLPEFVQVHCPLNQWYHPAILFSVAFSSHLQSFPASVSFQMSQLFPSDGQSIGASASASVLPMSIQDLFPSGLICLISLLSKGLSRIFSNTTVQKHQFFSAQLSL